MGIKRKILLIDDEKDFCFFIKQNLDLAGDFSVICAANPDEGIKIAKRELPHLILLDILMPRKSGFEVLKVLKKNTKTLSIPVIMLTAVEEDDAKFKASRLYGEDYITKPVKLEALREKIKAVLGRYRRV